MPSNESSSASNAGVDGASSDAATVSRPSSGTAPDPDDRRTIVFLHGTRLTGAADRVAELIEREGHDGRAILVGLSLGGYVAMDVAARRPDLVRGLVISGATAEPVGVRSVAYRGLAFVFRRTPPHLLDRTNRRFVAWRFPPAIADPILAAGFAFPAGEAALRALVGRRFRPRLAAYPGPSLILNGEFDLFFRPTEASFAAVAIDARRVIIRGATHLANLDRPAAFSAAVRRFALSLPA